MKAYSPQDKFRFLREFKSYNKQIKKLLEDEYGLKFARKASNMIKKEFKLLLEEMPYIGGDENPLTITLTSSTRDLAVYLVLKRMGKDVSEIGKICYQYAEEYFKNNSDKIMSMDNPQVINYLKYLAEESKKRKYPENYVYEFVEGEDFDFGLDFTECAICKFFHKKDADKFVPYICATDIPESNYGNLGLQRSGTLAEGYSKCDFRYKKGRKTKIASTVKKNLD
ncbi:MAG: L-2-amino-thiazoline-4-carboxylic acid hydrolase [Methanobacteriaceae archaeon]|nr:L-2-amino-thiazoline-4-carboxylic acid hydrolase [Methanobacteriaceae archaeon]